MRGKEWETKRIISIEALLQMKEGSWKERQDQDFLRQEEDFFKKYIFLMK